MKISAAAALFLASLSSANAADGFYQYDPAFDYSPASWASVAVDGNQCGGSSQSPIDVPLRQCGVFDDYIFSKGTCTMASMAFSPKPNGIQADYNADMCELPRMYIPGKELPFDALQFHIHIGSEHAMNGDYYGLEMHLVHKEVGGDRYAVLGLFMEPDSNAPEGGQWMHIIKEFKAVASSIQIACGTANGGTGTATVQQATTSNGGFTFDYYGLVPEDSSMYTYSGSLTTPPCSEVVEWNVVDKIVKLTPRDFHDIYSLILNFQDSSTCEYATFAARNGYTSRPVQGINGRDIVRVCPKEMENSVIVDEEPKTVDTTPVDDGESPVVDGVNATGNMTDSAASSFSSFTGVAVLSLAMIANIIFA